MNQKKKNIVRKQKEENLFTQMVERYISYWPAFLFFFVVAISGGFIFIRYATPQYEANATLIIKDEKKGSDDSKMIESLNTINTKKIIENEIEVLKSRSLMDGVVKALHLYAPVFQEGKIRTMSAYNFSPLIIESDFPDSLTEINKIFMRYDEKTSGVYLNNNYVGAINEWITTPYGRLRFSPNNKYVKSESNKPYFFSLIKPKNVTDNLLKNLTVSSANKLSSIIELIFSDEVPQKAEDVLNQLIVMYDRAAINEKNGLAKNTLKFVEERLNIVSKSLDSIENSVQQYKTGAGASDISTQGQLYLQNVSSNDQELGKINMQLSVLDQVEYALNSPNSDMMPSTIGINDPNLTKMMTDLNNKELEYERLKKTVAENNPMLVSIRDQINKIKPGIRDNLHSLRQNLQAGRNDLMTTNNRYNSMLSTIPEKERQLLEMSRDQNIKNGLYSFLLQKREESELSYASNISNSRVVNSAKSSKYPVSPNKILVMLIAIAASMGLCMTSIWAKENFSKTILYRKDLEEMTEVPVIGEVAHNNTKETLVIKAGKRSFIAEEFRKLRVSLHFLGIEGERKKILITSSIPGEGKSFIASNLAMSSSLTGKKVVLVDMDLHNPGLGKIFEKTTDDPGVSEFLMGKKSANDIIHNVPGHDNLFFISSGFIHESPSELILNGKIKELITLLESRFDLVVIDTAPSALITDAFVLSRLCDATLYVVRHKYTPKMLIKRIDENLEINPLNNPAIVFNGVKTRGFFKNNYGYGYDYVYGKNYYNESKKNKIT